MKGTAVYLFCNSLVALPFLLHQLPGDSSGWGGECVGVVNLTLPRKGKKFCLTANVCGAWLSRAFLWSLGLPGGWWLWLCEHVGVSKQEHRSEGMGENSSGMQKRQRSCWWHAAIFHCIACIVFHCVVCIASLSDHLLNQSAILLKQQPRSCAELSEDTGCRQTLQFNYLVAWAHWSREWVWAENSRLFIWFSK